MDNYSVLLVDDEEEVIHVIMRKINWEGLGFFVVGHGVYGEKFGGEHRKLIIKTVSYTGWKLVGVIPDSTFTQGMFDIRYFIIMIILLMAMMLAVINRVVSVRISSPILKLDDSVREYEAGEKPEIYIGGSQEIRHLGNSIQRSYEQIDRLMQEIVKEQNERRKSELDALQSQINPHFLYNALDSITWMIEGERNDDAENVRRQRIFTGRWFMESETPQKQFIIWIRAWQSVCWFRTNLTGDIRV